LQPADPRRNDRAGAARRPRSAARSRAELRLQGDLSRSVSSAWARPREMMPRSKAARRPSKAQRIKTAYHEAGPAVINRVLTLTCGPTTIKPDYEKQEWGHSISIALEHEWERCGKYRGPNAVWHAQIISRMAGAEAERELLDTESEGDHDDRLQIACVVSEFVPEDYFWDKLEPR